MEGVPCQKLKFKLFPSLSTGNITIFLPVLEHEVFLTQRRADAADSGDYRLCAHLARDHAFLLCDIAKALEEAFGVGGAN